MNEVLQGRLKVINEMAKDIGLDPYDIIYEFVSQDTMLEVISYGLPTRARHWSYGQSYEYQKAQGEMGFSKVYEVILNNDPSYAFMLDTNTDIANSMIIAHVIGHSHFFKNNYLFKKTDNKMVYHAAERAQRIEEYIQKYGIEIVEKTMDIGFALDRHINWDKGIHREKYQKRKPFFVNSTKDEFEDLLGKRLSKKMVSPKNNFPPEPEYDLLWLLTNYSSELQPWQIDVLEIIREESYYFYPQYMTKIMNEGFASFVHAELMANVDCINHAEHLEFCKLHEKVVQPGGSNLNINPYFLGFSIFTDIRKRWDALHKEGKSDLTGLEKVYKVVEDEDDISFIRNYLTKELAEELKLFSYEEISSSNGERAIKILDKKLDIIKETLVKDLYDYRAPVIAVTDLSDGFLQLEHRSKDVGTLDKKHAEKVMQYIFEAWGSPINLETADEEGEILNYTYDEEGFCG